jgi:hypothetical protein
MAKQRDTEPPQPPPFQRRIKIPLPQALGLAALCALVVAALAGLLGLTSGETQASNDGLQVTVSYPKVLRYRTSLPLEIEVRNAGSGALNRVDVRIDRSYLEAFQDVRLTPDAREVGARHVTVSLDGLPAGESRKVVAWLEAHQRGRQPARLQVAADSRPALELDWSTTVLP